MSHDTAESRGEAVSGNYCNLCGNFTVRGGKCQCRPFDVQEAGAYGGKVWGKAPDPHGWTEVFARDAEEAAEKASREFDRDGEYSILRRREGHMWVRDSDGKVTRWDIEAEAEPTYTAEEVTDSAGREA